jgi:hypothetical protein
MKKLIVCFSLCFLFILGTTSTGHSFDLTRRIGIGFGYPYFGIKYGINPGVSLEAKVAFGEGIIVGGPRIYCNFNPRDRTVYYLGGEVNYVTFDTEDAKGEGFIGGVFIGGEIFLSRSFSFNLDFGPYYTKLIDSEFTDLEVDGIDYVVNLGIHIYFGGGDISDKRLR